METIDTDWKTTKLKSLAKPFKPFNRDWAPLTMRLWARDFYEMIVDEVEGRINYRLIEIESE